MPSALSVDLRERFIEAGSSRRQAAKRFGVGKASAIRWHTRFRDAGEIMPKPAGGDRSQPVIDAHAEMILAIYREHQRALLATRRRTTSNRQAWALIAQRATSQRRSATKELDPVS